MRVKLKDVVHILKTTTHSAFPIVDTKWNYNDPDMPTYGRLRGLITRNDIIAMIYMRVFFNWDEITENGDDISTNESESSTETFTEKIQEYLETLRHSIDFDAPKPRPTPSPSDHYESFEKLNDLYPRFPCIEDLRISMDDEEKYFLDFSLAMDAAPHRVSSGMGYPQVFIIIQYR